MLLRRLKKPHLYFEALSVLQVANRLTRTGFQCVVEPTVVVDGRRRKPDLLLRDTAAGDQIYVEVTRLMSSDEAREADACLRAIDHVLRWDAGGVVHCGRIRKILVGEDLNRVVKTVKATVRNVRRLGGLQEVSHPDLELAICRSEDENLLASWTKKHGLQWHSLVGPRYEFSDLGRILPKAGGKQRQLPSEHPSLIAIWATSVFLSTSQIESVLGYLDRHQALLGHVYGVVILGEWLGVGDDEVRALGDHVYVAESRHDILQERIMLVANRHWRLPMSSEAEKRLRGAIIGRSRSFLEPS